MSIRLRVGQTLQLPSHNVVLILAIAGDEVRCVFLQPSRSRGEIEFSARWLSRCAVVLDTGR